MKHNLNLYFIKYILRGRAKICYSHHNFLLKIMLISSESRRNKCRLKATPLIFLANSETCNQSKVCSTEQGTPGTHSPKCKNYSSWGFEVFPKSAISPRTFCCWGNTFPMGNAFSFRAENCSGMMISSAVKEMDGMNCMREGKGDGMTEWKFWKFDDNEIKILKIPFNTVWHWKKC